ncbi:MAG: phage recombination protein Bet [Mycobacteriales bacterium]
MAKKKAAATEAPPPTKESAAQPQPEVALATRQAAPIVKKETPVGQFTDEQVALIKNTVARNTTDQELAWFLHVAKTLRLDPLRKQLHCIKRKMRDGEGWKEYLSIQTGIDGFRAIADRTHCYAPSEKPVLYEYVDKTVGSRGVRELFSATVWIKKFTPVDKTWHEYPATAIMKEFMPIESGGRIPFMWERMPHNQLEKCAEAKALRKGFPDELGDVYVHEEMARLDLESGNGSGSDTPKDRVENKTRRERGTLEPGKEANRGHDNEGFKDGPKTIDAEVVSTAQPSKAPQSAKEQKAEQKAAAIRVLEVTVQQIVPKLKNLTPEQAKGNAAARKAKQDEPHVRQPFYILQCAGDPPTFIYVWDQKLWKAALRSQNKVCVFGVSDKQAGEKTFINLEEIAGIGGVRYTRDPKTREFVPESEANAAEVPPAGPEPGEGFEGQPSGEQLFP